MAKPMPEHDHVAGSGCYDFGDFDVSKDEGKINVSRAGRPEADALGAFGGLSGGAKRNSGLSNEGSPDIQRPGYPMKGDGTTATSGDNGVRGSIGGDDKPETSGNSRHHSS